MIYYWQNLQKQILLDIRAKVICLEIWYESHITRLWRSIILSEETQKEERVLFAQHKQASLENSRRVSSWKSFIVFFSLTSPARSLEIGKVGGEF